MGPVDWLQGWGRVVLGQTTSPTPDINPIAYWGIAGAAIAFILWMFIEERRDHRALRQKVIDDVLPALMSNTEEMKEMSAALVMIHQIAGRPGLDPVQLAEYTHTMRVIRERLEHEARDRRSGSS